MLEAEHRRPLAGFVLVLAAACLIMSNGLRHQVVEILVESRASPELIAAVAPDLVLGQLLRDVPQAPRGASEQDLVAQGPTSTVPRVPGVEVEDSANAVPGPSATSQTDPFPARPARADRPGRAGRAEVLVPPRAQPDVAPATPVSPTAPTTPPATVPDRQPTMVTPMPGAGGNGSDPKPDNGTGEHGTGEHGTPGMRSGTPSDRPGPNWWPGKPGHTPDRGHHDSQDRDKSQDRPRDKDLDRPRDKDRDKDLDKERGSQSHGHAWGDRDRSDHGDDRSDREHDRKKAHAPPRPDRGHSDHSRHGRFDRD